MQSSNSKISNEITDVLITTDANGIEQAFVVVDGIPFYLFSNISEDSADSINLNLANTMMPCTSYLNNPNPEIINCDKVNSTQLREYLGPFGDSLKQHLRNTKKYESDQIVDDYT